jgi:NADH-quinone oxidoreductase subunit J
VTPLLAQATSSAADTAELVTFAVLAPASVVAALGVIFNRNAVYSALLLVLNFFCLAVFYVLLQAQFLAAVQVIVYAGAIMVLFLFVLMLLGVERRELLRESIRGQRVLAAALSLVLLAGVLAAVLTGVFPADEGALAAANTAAGGNVPAVGRLLFTRYTLAFEATGVLLLVAGVGALVLGKRRPGAEDDDELPGRVAAADAGPGPTEGSGSASRSPAGDVPPVTPVAEAPTPVGAATPEEGLARLAEREAT